ncbi:uncharacterized protein LOC136062326 [Quercus suber]|uniref:uncharacterized protein LOC136062326 n=1 Tax=Quercus suber TaxID=58331 RepID=UPI0032DEBA65
MDSAPSQLNFVRPLELCDFMYLELQKLRKRKDLRSQSQFNHFHSQRSALIDLLAICFKRYLETMDSAPSQLNFELPAELCDIMFLELQKLRNLEMEDLRSQLQSNDFHSQRSAWTDLLAICNKGYMETMDSEIEEADSAPSQLNFERLPENFLYCELQKLRKRNLEMEGPWPQLQFHHFHYEIVFLTDILATCKKLSRYVSDSEIEEADSAPSQFNFERLLELCDFMYWDLQKSWKWNLEMENLWSKWQRLYWYMSDSKIEKADWAPSRFKLEPLQQLRNFLCLNPLTRRKQILEYRDKRLLSQFAHRLPWPSEEKKLYLFFYPEDSPVMYILYEIKVTKPFPPPPTEAAQDANNNKWDLSGLNLILQFETGMYPEGMCCVQLGFELYFFGGEFNLNKPNICIYEDLKKFKKERWDVLPREGRPMNSGKASPQAFVADEMIYVIGSIFTNLDNESSAYFEVYDPVEGTWTVLPNPPIRNVNTRWVGNAVVGRKAVLVALQLGQNRLYCFDLDTRQWTNRVSIPDFLSGNFFLRKSEFIEDTLDGCYDNTVGAIAVEDDLNDSSNRDNKEEQNDSKSKGCKYKTARKKGKEKRTVSFKN